MENPGKSLALQYDLFFAKVQSLFDTSVERDYIVKLKLIDELMNKINECDKDQDQLKKQLNSYVEECSKLSFKLKTSARLYDEVQLEKKKIEFEKDCLKSQLDKLYNVLKRPSTEESSTQATSSHFKAKQSNENKVLDNTDALLTDLSYSRTDSSDVSFDNSVKVKVTDVRKEVTPLKKCNEVYMLSKQPGTVNIKEGRIVATTTFTMESGKINAKSVMESYNLPEPKKIPTSTTSSCDSLFSLVSDSSVSTKDENCFGKQHNFSKKKVVIAELCGYCRKKVKFNNYIYKCLDCKIGAHSECKNFITVSCTNFQKRLDILNCGVDPVIVHCISEIEKRGLETVGLYRVSGSEKEHKLLKEKFCKGLPYLGDIDIHVLCCYLKEYIRTQKNHIITQTNLDKFDEAVENQKDNAQSLSHAVFQLSPVNRVTLAYLMLHLQKVASSTKCNMDINNLSIVFGPTIIGYSSSNLDELHVKSRTSTKVIKELLKLPQRFWLNLINTETSLSEESAHSTPVHNKSVTPASSRRFFTSGMKKRILDSPKSNKAAKQVKIQQLESQV